MASPALALYIIMREEYVGRYSLLHIVTNLYALAMHHHANYSIHIYVCTQSDSLSDHQATEKCPPTLLYHTSSPYALAIFLHSSNTMNSALTLVSFQSPSLNLKQHPPSRRQQISAKWEKRQQCSPKPIRSIPGPKATRGLNKAFHGDGDNALPSSPLTDVIHEFYSSLNDKDIARLMELIDPDCTVEHASYYKPLNFKVILSSAPISLHISQGSWDPWGRMPNLPSMRFVKE